MLQSHACYSLTTKTVFCGSAHNFANDWHTTRGGASPVEPKMSRFKMVPTSSFMTIVPLKSKMMTLLDDDL